MLGRSQSINRACYGVLTYPPTRRLTSRHFGTFQVGDRILLRHVDKPEATPILTKPLKADACIESHRGAFQHNDIIGKRPRDVIHSSSGRQGRIHHPTLGEHIKLTSRLVTPIYPETADRIVSFLDIHVDASFAQENARPFEILEAGTGHGSLTLHLARAVHAANVGDNPQHEVEAGHEGEHLKARTRGAIVHTVDISAAHSRRAQTVISEFRRGMYKNSVDFHVGDLASFIQRHQDQWGSRKQFLDVVVLDMPSAHEQIETVTRSMVVDGSLALFCPHITQIMEAMQLVRNKRLPLFLEQVVELNSVTSGGRPWDVRFVKPRTRATKTQASATSGDSENDATEANTDHRAENGAPALKDDSSASEGSQKLDMICRPKFGEMITAGGFLGLWKKMDY